MSMWKRAFEALNTALGVVASAGNIPGVKLIPHVGTITAAAGAIQSGLSLGIRVAPYIKAIVDTYTGDGLPTEEQRLALDAKITELEAKVQARLPPKEDGEPD